MKVISFLILSLLLLSCADGMTNEEIAKQKKICDEAGLYPEFLRNGFTNEITKVQCISVAGKAIK